MNETGRAESPPLEFDRPEKSAIAGVGYRSYRRMREASGILFMPAIGFSPSPRSGGRISALIVESLNRAIVP
jgi:hypothetical protein